MVPVKGALAVPMDEFTEKSDARIKEPLVLFISSVL